MRYINLRLTYLLQVIAVGYYANEQFMPVPCLVCGFTCLSFNDLLLL